MTVALPPGVYVPIPTFFLDQSTNEQPIDVDTITRHVEYLCSAKVHGIVCMGSTGEAVHLNDDERQLVLRTARKAIDMSSSSSSSTVKLLAGCSKESVRDTLQLIQQAAQNGADYAMVLPPSYYLAWTSNRSDVIDSFYSQVADRSPIPIVIYNFPGVTQQMDTTQDTIVKLAAHPNIVGIKCTDGNVGKAAYICANTDREQFTVMSGSADSLLPFLSIGAQGCIPGFANVAPRTLVHLFTAFMTNPGEQLKELQRIQGKIAGSDHAFFRWNGISGLKAAMEKILGYGGQARAPLLPTTAEQQENIMRALEPALEIEQQLITNSDI
jgi:dihydrodipicolinate synthase/N-acetylneuraminate lyase